MDQNFVDTLLDQARMVASYAVNTGQYPRNSRIFKEISAVSQAHERGEIPAIEPLICEMQKVSDEVGVTVAQVMRLETLAGRLRWKAALATPYLIGFMTLVLTLYLAFQSSELHKADLSLREYQDMLGEHLPDKVYLAWKMYEYDDVINSKTPPLAELDNYHKLVDEAKRVNERRIAVQKLLQESAVVRYVPELFQFHGPLALREMAQLLNGPPLPSEPTDDRLLTRSATAGATTTDQEVATGSASPPQLPTVTEIDCTDLISQPIKGERPAKADHKISLGQHDRAFDCFLQALHLDSDYGYPMDPLIYATRNKVSLLTSWLLPGLYGLLGACVFLMRRMLDVNGPGKNPARIRVVHLLSLLLRAALGGLAGIIIGWFWVPTSLTASSSAISVSSIPFGIAFLAGFSIDSLFALLEGLVKNFQSKDERSDGQTVGGRRVGDKTLQTVGAEPLPTHRTN